MSTIEPAGEHGPLYSPDGVVGARRSTARLFGAFLYRERTRRGLSADVLLQEKDRTEAWLLAIERGEVIPTPAAVKILEGCFIEADGSDRPDEEKRVGLQAALVRLEAEPYGLLATELRNGLNLQMEFDELPESGTLIGDGPCPW